MKRAEEEAQLESRARGRARGRSRGPSGSSPGTPGGSPASGDENKAGDNGNGNGNGNGSIRGRAQYRTGVLVTRPKMIKQTTGSGGRDVKLLCNYFRMTFDAKQKIYQYHVDFEPEVEASRMRRALLLEHKEALGNAFLFDGMSDLKILKQLTGEELQFVAVRQSDNANITVTLRFTNEVPWNAQEMMRLFNTQMRRNLAHIGYSLIGRHYYDKQGGRTIAYHGGIKVFRGIFTAIAKHESGVLMACDTIYKFIRSQTVRDLLADLARNRETYKDQARKQLSGAVVMTRYNDRTYKVDDIAFEKTPEDTFEKRGETITYIEYYQKQYEITISDPKQPLIACLPSARDRRAGRTDKVYLIPELCLMTGLTDEMRADRLCKQIDEISKLDPQKRVDNLRSFMQQLGNNQHVRQEMGTWKLAFDPNLVEIPARQLPGEKILMHGESPDDGTPYEQNKGDFTKEIRGKHLRATVGLNKWMILVSTNDRDCVSDFTSTLSRVCNPMGIALARPKILELPADRTSNFVNALKDTPRIEEADIVCCIVPNNNKDRYDSIKKLCCCDIGIPSQVVCQKTLSKKSMLMSVCTKIAIQMACKIGAEAWALRIPPKELMVIGYDTYHDATMRGKSAGGFVASMNQSLTRWFSKVAFHGNREEMSGNFAVNLKESMKRYHKINGKLPERIVIYRDGVGDGMIPHVFNYEMDQIKKAFNEIAKENPPKLAFIIVTKRINTKFFAKSNGGPIGNPPPGTVVDTVVTKEERYEFYLISQSVRQGTVAPTLFNIIQDDTNWRPEHHQALAYKLTHLYYNWMGTIRVPAPCQYAHKLAYLTGTSLHRESKSTLSNTLFYL